jgi:pyruvate/2-oxoglutarate/acetoin dehydrogenase E1 component
MSNTMKTTYAEAIRQGFDYLLEKHPNVFIIGQGVWSPWYVGSTMTDLEKKFGKDRVIDSPVSEAVCTGAAVGASLFGYRPVVIHPRIDFMILASDALVNQAAKWSHMLGGQAHPAVTIRGIVNRGGEQGAQHSQALHSWYAHIPGLRVVMPATPEDARDLLISSVLCDDPVLYIDDRWLYSEQADLPPIREQALASQGPKRVHDGVDVTIVASSYSTKLAMNAACKLALNYGISADVIDLRIINPLDYSLVAESVTRTGRLIVVDGGWRTCGLAGEIIAGVAERVPRRAWKEQPRRITLPDAPAPTSLALEKIYYPDQEMVLNAALKMFNIVLPTHPSEKTLPEALSPVS